MNTGRITTATKALAKHRQFALLDIGRRPMSCFRRITNMASPRHFNIVALETFFTPLPELSVPSPHTFSVAQYDRTTIDEIPARIQNADVLITTTIPLRKESLSREVCPNLQLIAVLASGTDSLDLEICKERGIRVLNSPSCNVDAVAEHAVALYFATRRSIMPIMRDLKAGEWPRQGSLMKRAFVAGQSPRGCRDETVAIIGYGAVGRKVESLLGSLGMKVLVTGRKNSTLGAAPGRVDFDRAIKNATVLVFCCPRTPETVGMISKKEFDVMRSDALVINVARGGIIDEEGLLDALREGKIAGAGVDVFDKEPASGDSSVLLGKGLDDLNLVVTPHTAWVGMDTTANYQRVLQENIDGFIQTKF